MSVCAVLTTQQDCRHFVHSKRKWLEFPGTNVNLSDDKTKNICDNIGVFFSVKRMRVLKIVKSPSHRSIIRMIGVLNQSNSRLALS